MSDRQYRGLYLLMSSVALVVLMGMLVSYFLSEEPAHADRAVSTVRPKLPIPVSYQPPRVLQSSEIPVDIPLPAISKDRAKVDAIFANEVLVPPPPK